MKVEAYRCDRCGNIRIYEEVTGVTPIEDLFEKLKSYPICNPEKSNVHYCLQCYEKEVLNFARLIDRKREEYLYAAKLVELQYSLKQTCVNNVRMKKKFARSE